MDCCFNPVPCFWSLSSSELPLLLVFLNFCGFGTFEPEETPKSASFPKSSGFGICCFWALWRNLILGGTANPKDLNNRHVQLINFYSVKSKVVKQINLLTMCSPCTLAATFAYTETNCLLLPRSHTLILTWNTTQCPGHVCWISSCFSWEISTSCKKQTHAELILLNWDLLPERPVFCVEEIVISVGWFCKQREHLLLLVHEYYAGHSQCQGWEGSVLQCFQYLEYRVSNWSMTWTGKDLDGSGHSLIKVLIQHLHEKAVVIASDSGVSNQMWLSRAPAISALLLYLLDYICTFQKPHLFPSSGIRGERIILIWECQRVTQGNIRHDPYNGSTIHEAKVLTLSYW